MISTATIALTVSLLVGQAETKQDEFVELLHKKRQILALAVDMFEEPLSSPRVPGAPDDPPVPSGTTDYFRLTHALLELAEVDLALAPSDAARLETLEALVARMRKLETQANEIHAAGLVTLVDVCFLRAGLVDAQMMLLKEKQAAAESKPGR